MTRARARVGVVGSVNVDLVVRCEALPRPGETVLAGDVHRFPGGKAGNQATALARLGLDAALIARVGDDDLGQWLVDLLAANDVDTGVMQHGTGATGTAFIAVDAAGENQIIVSRGANADLDVSSVDLAGFDAVLAQMEVAADVIDEVALRARALVLNVAPARPVDPATLARCAVVIANELEAERLDLATLAHCVVTLGSRGAVHFAHGREVARVTAPAVTVVDTVGAGDVFCAAYTSQFVAGADATTALAFAVTAGSMATQALGAQGFLPTTEEVTSWLARASS